MSEIIVGADAEQVVLTWLRARVLALAPLPAFADGVRFVIKLKPGETPTGPHVRIRRSGGTIVNLVEDAARIDFQVRHDTDGDRMALAQWVRGLAFSSRGSVVTVPRTPGPVSIGRWSEFVGPGRFPDPDDTEREIILFTAEVRLRAAAA